MRQTLTIGHGADARLIAMLTQEGSGSAGDLARRL